MSIIDKEEVKQKESEEQPAIKETLEYALSCYAGALKELPETAKANGLDYVKFDTGFKCPETRRVVDKSSTVLKTSYNYVKGIASYFADTEGKLEKHWKENGADAETEEIISESSVEKFLEAFRNAISEVSISTARGSFENQLPEDFRILGKLAFKDLQAFEGGFSNFYFRSGVGDADPVADRLKSKGETVLAVKELILWCLGGGSADKWVEK